MRIRVEKKKDYCFKIMVYMEAEIWEALLDRGKYLCVSLSQETWHVMETEFSEISFYLPGKREDEVELEATWEHHFDDETFESLEEVLKDVKASCENLEIWSSEF